MDPKSHNPNLKDQIPSEEFSPFDEDKFIEEVITTPYEKVLKILKQIQTFLFSLNIKGNQMANELEWVIKRISSHSLYTYDISYDVEELEKYSEDNAEIKQFLEFLADFSETTDIKRRNKIFHSNTQIPENHNETFDLNTPSANLKKKIGTILPTTGISSEKLLNSIMEEGNVSNNKLIRSFKKQLTMKLQQPKAVDMEEGIKSDFNRRKSKVDIPFLEPLSPERMNTHNKLPTVTKSNSDDKKVLTMIDHLISPKELTSIDFDIHEFCKHVGHDNVLPFVGKTLFDTFGLCQFINSNKLDAFLTEIRNGYDRNILYHNSLHASDVAQTIGVYLLNSKFENVVKTNANDLISIFSASLAHDLGHPGTNNGFQQNSYSDIAITYNDVSILENYHSSNFFWICKRDECNIFDVFSSADFKFLRKRIVSMILSTDMSQHAKIIGMFKNKVNNFISEKGSMEDFISPTSPTIWDEQQQVLDFMIHTADLAHNSKKFKVSHNWSSLLMEEFWLQGDKEKELGLPVSFLCDRNTTDTPKSQIGFIKGIIIPTFEVLVNLFPTLKFSMENIEKNIEEWGKLADCPQSNSPKYPSSPRMFNNRNSIKEKVSFKFDANFNDGKVINLNPMKKK